MESKNYVSVGCSYAIYIQGVNNGYYKMNSFSQSGILDAIRYYKNQHLNSTWVVGITQSARLTKKIPTEVYYPNYISDTEGDIYGGYRQIGNERYTTFIENDDVVKTKSDFPYEWWSSERHKHFNKSIEEHLIEYLDSIYEIQQELKDYELKMFLMNNTFEGYYYDREILCHKYSNNTKYETQDLRNTLSLSDLFPNEWNKLDLSKICFYQTEYFRYGGIDEYTIDNYPLEFFGDIKFREVESPYGCHPIPHVQKDFIEKILKL
jgi:hypothetical protein